MTFKTLSSVYCGANGRETAGDLQFEIRMVVGGSALCWHCALATRDNLHFGGWATAAGLHPTQPAFILEL